MNENFLKPGDWVTFDVTTPTGKFKAQGQVVYADHKGAVRVKPNYDLPPGASIDASTIKKVG